MGKGTIRIESDVDDVPIVIRKGQEVVEQLTVTQQGTSIRVAAGEYTVEIDGDIDGVNVSENVIQLLRGVTSVARITEQQSSSAGIANIDPEYGPDRINVNKFEELGQLHGTVLEELGQLHGSVLEELSQLHGSVLSVRNGNLVEVSIGSDDGLQNGTRLEVFRDNKYLGQVDVVSVGIDKSVARTITVGELENEAIRVGDEVAHHSRRWITENKPAASQTDIQGRWRIVSVTRSSETEEGDRPLGEFMLIGNHSLCVFNDESPNRSMPIRTGFIPTERSFCRHFVMVNCMRL